MLEILATSGYALAIHRCITHLWPNIPGSAPPAGGGSAARKVMYTVYALYNSEHNKIYIGQTADLKERLHLHKQATFKKSYTSRFSGKWVVIYSEQASDRAAALLREKQLKSFRGREFVKTHIPR